MPPEGSDACVCVCFQQLLNQSQTALVPSPRTERRRSVTTPSGLTSSLTTLQPSRRRRFLLQSLGPTREQPGHPAQDRALLLLSTLTFLQLKTWRRQRPETFALRSADSVSQRKRLPDTRRLTLQLSRHRNQKQRRRRRNLERKTSRIALRHSRRRVQPRGVKAARTPSWSV